MTDFGLGRLYVPDQRDTAYPMRALIPQTLPAYRYWRAGPVLDQGATGQCVGYAWRGWLAASPIMVKDGPSGHDIYCRCCAIDGWPQNDNCDVNYGTGTRDGAKVLQQAGHIAEYRWAFSPTDARDWVLTKGPAVLGTAWTEQMFVVDAKGFISVDGAVVGGHAYLAIGFDTVRDAFRIVNSWSRGWGQEGRAWLRRADLQKLWDKGDAEACAAVERAVDYNPYD